MLSEDKLEYIKKLQHKMDGLKSVFIDKYAQSIKIDGNQIKQRMEQGRALIDKSKMKIDKKLLEELSVDFWQALKDFTNSDGDSYETKIDIEKVTRLILADDIEGSKSLAHKVNINDWVLLFLGLNLAQALMGAYAYKLRGKVSDSWLKGFCPVCGGAPYMERFTKKDDGKRILTCQFCGTEWVHRRIMCPFCENDDHNSLRYFFVEKDSPYRVDVCDRCKKYIKGIDERKMSEGKAADLSIENISTLYLDVLAQKDGYQNPTFWMTGFTERELV